MTDYTPSRILQDNGAGDAYALGLTKAANEVLAAFNRKTVMQGKHIVKQANGQVSMQFPAIGKATAAYHVPGTELTGGAIKSGEMLITADELLVAQAFIPRIDVAKSHFNVQPEYTLQLGDALAQAYDRHLLSLAVKAARAGTSGPTDDHGNAVSVYIGTSPSTATLKTAFYDAQVAFDEGDVPEDERWAFVSPAIASQLGTDTTLTSADFDRVGANSLIKGYVRELAGFKIVKTNNLVLDHTTATVDTASSKYGVDASDTGILFMQRGALGTLELMGIRLEHEYQISRKGTFMTADMAVGHGVLRPDLIREARAAAAPAP